MYSCVFIYGNRSQMMFRYVDALCMLPLYMYPKTHIHTHTHTHTRADKRIATERTCLLSNYMRVIISCEYDTNINTHSVKPNIPLIRLNSTLPKPLAQCDACPLNIDSNRGLFRRTQLLARLQTMFSALKYEFLKVNNFFLVSVIVSFRIYGHGRGGIR